MRAKLVFLFLLGISIPSLSSESEGSYGFVGGMSSFNQSIKNSGGAVDDSTSSDLGAYVGVFGERYLSESLILAPGIYFSQKGAKNDSASRRTNYLETSAQLRWYFLDGSRLRSYLGFGGAFGILLSAEDSTTAGVASNKFDYFSKNELSAQLGWGLEFPLAQETRMQLGLTYARSLTNFLDPTKVAGDRGTWNGFYSFVALRFKSQKDESDAHERALDYLRWKNAGSAPVSSEKPAPTESASVDTPVAPASESSDW